MKKIALFAALLCAALHVFGQYNTNRNKIWAFGNNAGLNFNSGTPIPFTTSMNAWEGSASVCNTVGQLLFYTDGNTIYNRLGAVMPGGSAVVPFIVGSTTQAAVIVPFISDTNKYYVFSLETNISSGHGRLAYSVVDMTLNAGLGDLVAGSIGIPLDTAMSEKMFAVSGNGCNIWLMAHRRDTTQFYAYAITPFGINAIPVISTVGAFHGTLAYETGVMKCSPDRQKIVCHSVGTSSSGSSGWGIELYDFDPGTGIVSNNRTLEHNPMPSSAAYGAEFSPDNTKLYATLTTNVYQWDLSLSTTAAIIASKTLVGTIGTYMQTDLRLGPDAKIYLNSALNSTFLNRINFPNLPGVSCGYTSNAVNVYPDTVTLGFPSIVWTAQPVPATDALCLGMIKTMTPAEAGGTWSSGNPSVATIGATSGLITGIAAGTTAISYTYPGGCREITVVTVSGPTISPISGINSICETAATSLSCGPSGGTWSSSTPSATITSSGIVTGITAGTTIITYKLSAGCFSTDTVIINPLPAPITGLTTVALAGSRTLSCSTPGGTWSSSDVTKATVNSTTGKVSGVALGSTSIYYTLPTGCKVSVVVTVVKNTSVAGIPDITKPALYPNPATNDVTVNTKSSAFTSFTIYNAVGQPVSTHEITGSEMKVNVRSLPPGEYQVIFKGDDAREMLRFVKW